MSKPELSRETWETLLRKGAVRPLRPPRRVVPTLDALIESAKQRGRFGVTLVVPLPDPEAEPADQLVKAIVHDDAENWLAEDPHPGVALALALARAFDAKFPRQSPLFGANGHDDAGAGDDAVIEVEATELVPGTVPAALAEVSG